MYVAMIIIIKLTVRKVYQKVKLCMHKCVLYKIMNKFEIMIKLSAFTPRFLHIFNNLSCFRLPHTIFHGLSQSNTTFFPNTLTCCLERQRDNPGSALFNTQHYRPHYTHLKIVKQQTDPSKSVLHICARRNHTCLCARDNKRTFLSVTPQT